SSEETSSGAFTDSSIRPLSPSSKQSRSSSWGRVVSGNTSEAYPSIPASKEKRILDLYAGLTGKYRLDGPHPKEIEILTEGMDTLDAAKYLRELHMFDDALEYAERALIENPESFEALLLRTQLLPSDRQDEREAGLRRLLQMNPNSVEALVGLGATINSSQPSEAIQHLQKAIKIAPSYKRGLAYVALGDSYERLGRYDEALAAFRKAYQIHPGQVAGAHIRAIEEGNPIIKPMQRESQGQLPEEPPP
ncbi:tetratricopeptide repeat protein, partial [Candidatus Poribacteria bacterium]|nr:tetratricopeptide repeat protein [Candidatus Poribacteria bacterium]